MVIDRQGEHVITLIRAFVCFASFECISVLFSQPSTGFIECTKTFVAMIGTAGIGDDRLSDLRSRYLSHQRLPLVFFRRTLGFGRGRGGPTRLAVLCLGIVNVPASFASASCDPPS